MGTPLVVGTPLVAVLKVLVELGAVSVKKREQIELDHV